MCHSWTMAGSWASSTWAHWPSAGSRSDDIRLLELVADHITEATSARLARIERDAALALQRGLLPTKPPEVPGWP